jgi:hypothetical protein
LRHGFMMVELPRGLVDGFEVNHSCDESLWIDRNPERFFKTWKIAEMGPVFLLGLFGRLNVGVFGNEVQVRSEMSMAGPIRV